MDVGCYCVDVTRHIFGEQPLWAMASQQLHPAFGCDMSTTAILGLSSDRTALVSCGFGIFETPAVDQFLVETDYFADCVRGRSAIILDPHKEAVLNATTIESIRLVAKSGSRVETLAARS